MPNSSGAEEDDQTRLSRAYNNSIYLMVGMPYLLLGAVGYLIYRGVRQKALAQQPLPVEPGQAPDLSSKGHSPGGLTQGDRTCSLPSRGAAS